MYLTFAQYQEYGGKLKETDFNRFEFRAESKLNESTFNRLMDVPSDERIQRCVYDLVDYMSSNNASGSTKAVNSVSNDGYSVTYASSEKTADEEINDIVRMYFLQTDMMYAGTDGEMGKYMSTAPKGWEYLLVRSEK